MKKKLRLLFICVAIIVSTNYAQIEKKGWWTFNDTSNVLAPIEGYGLPLELVGKQEVVSGFNSSDFAVKIGPGNHYKMTHQIAANGGGTKVNEYSIQIDFKVETTSVWHAFFQINPNNNDDGDCFINTVGNIGVGVTGYSTYSVKPNEWYRLVLSVENGVQHKYYLDGQLIHSGVAQSVDGRFALESVLLMLADEDGEDNNIYVTQIAIWDNALTQYEVSSLGGFGHQITPTVTKQLILVPYLSVPKTNSMQVSWHDTLSSTTSVEFGTTSSLGETVVGTNEIIYGEYRWHTAKLANLLPNTEYFYKVVSGSGESEIYSFKTQPDDTYTGKLRFLLFSDTHASDTSWAVKVLKQARIKTEELFGNDIHNYINFVLHSGDLVVDGGNIVQYTDQYFAPMSSLSTNLPIMTISGNHEGENANYYHYMHYEDALPVPAANERFWSFRVANSVFIGLNSNAISTYGTLQTAWFDNYLATIENDSTIDFVFVMSHHFAISELWGEGMTYDQGPSYIANTIYPILKKYSKVVQHSYGHTHAYERGTLVSNDIESRGDFRIVCGGGGGGNTDNWGEFVNQDFNDIQVSMDHYFFQLVEIDVANKTWESKMYSLGNDNKLRNNELMDYWYRKTNQPAPETPIAYNPGFYNERLFTVTSPINADSLMTVHIQIADNPNFTNNIIDTLISAIDIYEDDSAFNPTDLNANLDLTELEFDANRFTHLGTYFYRVKYRDYNAKWSNWSNVVQYINEVGVNDNSIPTEYKLNQNYPNPFNPSTEIGFSIPTQNVVKLKLYNSLGQEIATLINEEMSAGNYNYQFSAGNYNLSSGIYYYQLSSGSFIQTNKMLLLK